jgi:hypothetical protein
MPSGGAGRHVVDESDDADGHHIFINPWATDDEPDR